MGRRVAAALGVLVVAAFPGTGSAEPALGDRRVFVLSLAATPDGVYAVERTIACERDCERLVRTRDGGSTWQRLAARGWRTSEVVATAAGGATVLLSPAPDGVQVSRDGGASFETVRGPAGSVVPAGNGTVFLGGADGSAALLHVSSLHVTPLPQLPLRNARVVPHPAYPAVPSGEPYAIVSGSDPDSGFPVVARCDARWDCAARTVVVPREDAPRAYVSPAFLRDRTVVVTLARGGLYLSNDGGTTFVPQVVAPPRADEAIATYPAVAFGAGRVYAAAITASTGGGLAGGVFSAGPGGGWTRVGGPSSLDDGATALTLTDAGAVFAAYLAPPAGGVVCAEPGRSWTASCAAERAPARPRDVVPAPAGQVAAGSVATRASASPVPAGAAAGEAPVPARLVVAPAAKRENGRSRGTPFVLAAAVVLAAAALVRVRAGAAREAYRAPP